MFQTLKWIKTGPYSAQAEGEGLTFDVKPFTKGANARYYGVWIYRTDREPFTEPDIECLTFAGAVHAAKNNYFENVV